MHSCMVKASKTCLTADANYGLTGLLYAQTNTIYRFYVYDLVIDDAPAIIYASIGHCKIWDQQICLWAHRVRRSEVAKKMSQNLTFFWFGRAPARIFLDWYGTVPSYKRAIFGWRALLQLLALQRKRK